LSTYDTPIPGGSGYEQANLLARRAYENAMTRLSQMRSQRLLRAGYVRDAQGNLSVDPNNEYGDYQQMLRNESGQTHHLERAQLASGWGGSSGVLVSQRDELQHAQGGEQAAFGQALTGDLADIASQEENAAMGRDQALYQNELDAARNAIDQGNYNPADYNNLDVPPYGDQSDPTNGAGPAPPPPPRSRPRQDVHRRGKAQLVRHAARRGRRR
jgi:hypothetical protein